MFQTGLIATADTAAFLLIGLPAGAWVDRLRRRPILVAADLARALLVSTIPVAAAAGLLTLPSCTGWRSQWAWPQFSSMSHT